MTIVPLEKQELFGVWESTEAFGNTSLDWSQALKDKKATLRVEFLRDLTYTFEVFEGKKDDTLLSHTNKITHNFRHVLSAHGKFELEGNKLKFQGDISGLTWTYQNEEDNTLRIRIEGAKRFGRCKGVDVIYFKQGRDQ